MDTLIQTIAEDLLETCEEKDKRYGHYDSYLPVAIEAVREALVPAIAYYFAQIPVRYPGYRGDNLKNVVTFDVCVAVPWHKGLPLSWHAILSSWDSHLIEKPFYYGVTVRIDTLGWEEDFARTGGQMVMSVEGPAAHDLFTAMAKAGKQAR